MSNVLAKPDDIAAPSNARGTTITYRQVSKTFRVPGGQTLTALKGVAFGAEAGRVTALCGPSGCGKTTLLRMAAGLEQATDGDVLIGDVAISSVPDARSAGVGLITQDANLLPWMTVLDNVALPLKFLSVSKKDRIQRAREWLEKMQIGPFEKFYPSQLSGGMQKRCSMARTMVYEPKVLLMDEPFGALDAMTRLTLQGLVSRLVEETESLTVMMVTHDLAEAIALSDQVVMINGKPGQVRDVVTVPIARPRDVDQAAEDPVFATLHSRLRKALTDVGDFEDGS